MSETSAAGTSELDRKQLLQLRKRFQTLSRARLERLRSITRDRERDLVDVLPLLFHVNHALLPGWINAETPCSIVDYTPTQTALQAAHKLARSFTHEKRAAMRHDILGLYLMGSAGTLGQSGDSDLDVWVVVRDALDPAARAQLQRKCERIMAFAGEQGCSLHCYLMSENSFRSGDLGSLSDEHSGSTQRWLLLDEFYRTSVWLAGRFPLWWLIPPEPHLDYAQYAQRLLVQRFVKPVDYLDFGAVPVIPPEEFFSGAVWQLYKAIDSPYKSVLKLLLMEAYAQSVPPLPPLSQLFKQSVYDGQDDVDALDPYGLMYATVENYLQTRGEHARLELLRRCLYLKADEKVSRGGSNWQRERLRALSSGWGWDQKQWRDLDARRSWRYERVASEQRELVNELSASYRALSAYARLHATLAQINQQELTVLGRKLYAALERRAGKIEVLQNTAAYDLAEPVLVLRGPDDAGIWSLHRDVDRNGNDTPPLRRAQDAVTLMIWAQANRLHTRQTRCKVAPGSALTLADWQAISRYIDEWLPRPLPVPDDQDLQEAVTLTRALLLINVGVDPMAERTQKGIHLVSSRIDALAYGTQRENLVQRLHLIWLNSWGELCVQRFDRHICMADLLMVLHQQLGERALLPPISVQCFSGPRSGSIVRRVTDILDQFLGSARQFARYNPTRYILRIGDGYQVCLLDGMRGDRIDCSDFAALLDVLAQPLPAATELVFDPLAVDDAPLELIYQQRRQGTLQLFFRVETDRVDLFLLDESDALCVAQQPYHDLESLLRPWCTFLSNVSARVQALRGASALPEPELYEIVRPRAGEVAHLRRLMLPDNWLPARHYTVTARARLEHGALADLTLTCDDTDYAEWEWGTALYAQVMRSILAQRRRRERYPCYLTDLVLDETSAELSCAHFMRFKLQLEEQLNAALDTVRDDVLQATVVHDNSNSHDNQTADTDAADKSST